MGSFDDAEVCKLVGMYILRFLAKLINKKDCGLFGDDGLLILGNVNGQQINRMYKNIIKIFQDIGFTIDVETKLKAIDFLDITFNLNNGTYRSWCCFAHSKALSRMVSVMDGQNPLISNLMIVEFLLSSMFLNHPIALAEFFHWLTYNNLTKCWFIFSKINLLIYQVRF